MKIRLVFCGQMICYEGHLYVKRSHFMGLSLVGSKTMNIKCLVLIYCTRVGRVKDRNYKSGLVCVLSGSNKEQ